MERAWRGPTYRESDFDALIVDPWSTVTNLAFLAIVVYWALRLRRDPAGHGFSAAALVVLFIGFVGGTVYHALRAHPVWLLLDWGPILVLCLAASVFLWVRAGLRWYFWLPLLAVPRLVLEAARAIPGLPRGMWVNLVYLSLALVVVLPLFLHLRTRQWVRLPLVLGALAAFAFALTCRALDRHLDLPMGTHWLWHLGGAAATHLLLAYIVHDEAAHPPRAPARPRTA